MTFPKWPKRTLSNHCVTSCMHYVGLELRNIWGGVLATFPYHTLLSTLKKNIPSIAAMNIYIHLYTAAFRARAHPPAPSPFWSAGFVKRNSHGILWMRNALIVSRLWRAFSQDLIRTSRHSRRYKTWYKVCTQSARGPPVRVGSPSRRSSLVNVLRLQVIGFIAFWPFCAVGHFYWVWLLRFPSLQRHPRTDTY
jgi:hypothetical protein